MPQVGQTPQAEQKPEQTLQDNTPPETKVIFERYIEPRGTKIEVDPTDVTTSCDVIKKKEKKKSIQ